MGSSRIAVGERAVTQAKAAEEAGIDPAFPRAILKIAIELKKAETALKRAQAVAEGVSAKRGAVQFWPAIARANRTRIGKPGPKLRNLASRARSRPSPTTASSPTARRARWWRRAGTSSGVRFGRCSRPSGATDSRGASAPWRTRRGIQWASVPRRAAR